MEVKEKLVQKNVLFWPRPIFTPSRPGIIVSAEAFQDSVREGKSWFHFALETRTQRSNENVRLATRPALRRPGRVVTFYFKDLNPAKAGFRRKYFRIYSSKSEEKFMR